MPQVLFYGNCRLGCAHDESPRDTRGVGAVVAAPGDLDTSFSTDGIVMTAIGTNDDYGHEAQTSFFLSPATTARVAREAGPNPFTTT